MTRFAGLIAVVVVCTAIGPGCAGTTAARGSLAHSQGETYHATCRDGLCRWRGSDRIRRGVARRDADWHQRYSGHNAITIDRQRYPW